MHPLRKALTVDNITENPNKIRRFPRTDPRRYFTWDEIPRFNPELFKSLHWIIDPFLAEGCVQLIYGERGAFKSTFLAFAARAVADGQQFLGMKVRRRRVLFLDYENPASVIKQRNDYAALNLPRNKNLAFWNRFGSATIPTPGAPELEGIIRDCIETTGHPPWLIFDSFSSLLKPGEGGEFTGQVAPLYLQFRRLSDMGATVTVVDHPKKTDRTIVYGGQDKEAKADSIHRFTLRRDPARPRNPLVEVTSWLKRAAPEGEGSFAFEVQTEEDQSGTSRIVDIVHAGTATHATHAENVEILRTLIVRNPAAGQESLARLAVRQGIPRDEAISLLRSGQGKHWTVERGSHNKFFYRLL